jgi:hypothetical protein
MAAGQTQAQMHPGRADFQAFFTAGGASLHRLNSRYVWAGHGIPPWLKDNEKVSFTRDRNPQGI